MIFGVGIDILDTARVKRQLARYGDHFKSRIFTQTEISYCDSKAFPHIHYAARFAAKEAFLKALGSGLRDGIQWIDIAVTNDAHGKPALVIDGTAFQKYQNLGITQSFLSLSHTRRYAAALVVLEQEEQLRKE